jgi:tRNA 2-selenouridine synthase
MIKPITPHDYFTETRRIPIVDVRAPVEYAHGHIPGAINIPLFSDEERAIIGTIYKQEGHEPAVRKGFELVSPHITKLIDETKKHVASKELVLYCARGGMRSRSIAMLLDFAGYTIHLMTGGFKAYKHFLRIRAGDYTNFILLGGKTGSGKTAILAELERLGEQVIDLETLACHRGSALGSLGQLAQPTQEQFIINCLSRLAGYDQSRPIWFEHEGVRLGEVQVPHELVTLMVQAPVIHIELPIAYRSARLMQEYGCFLGEKFGADVKTCIKKMEQRLGSEATKQLLTLVDQNATEQILAILLDHYDRAYTHSMERNTRNTFYPLTLESTSPAEHARLIQEFAKDVCTRSAS